MRDICFEKYVSRINDTCYTISIRYFFVTNEWEPFSIVYCTICQHDLLSEADRFSSQVDTSVILIEG